MFTGIINRFRSNANGALPRLGEVAGRARYANYELLARPIREGAVWRVAGTIRRIDASDADDASAEDFIRVDTVSDEEEAVRLCLHKARQLIDDRGEGPSDDSPIAHD